MRAYVDSSVVLRVVLRQRGRLTEWDQLTDAWSSELLAVEVFRTIDRMRLTGILGVGPAQQANAAAHRALADVQMVPVGRDALHQAQQPMLAIVHTLDAIHIATALDVLQREPDLLFATHDRQQAAAATALGLKVIGV